jgi:hypothetical protein
VPTLIRSRPTRALLAALLAGALLALGASPAGAQSPLAQGPGGPILTVVNPADPFGDYYSEILRAEGLNEFAAVNASSLSAQTLAGHDVVVLASMTLSTAQVQTLSDWGGNLIAMRPDKKLGAARPHRRGATLTNGYLKVDTSRRPAPASPADDAVPRHRRPLHAGRRERGRDAVLDATTATANPAVTLRSASAPTAARPRRSPTTSRARSSTRARATRPGPGQERDGDRPDPLRRPVLRRQGGRRAARLGRHDKDRDPAGRRAAAPAGQPDHADERLDRTPLPRFWYLPRGEKAAVVMTGDDHGPRRHGRPVRPVRGREPGGLLGGRLAVRALDVLRLSGHADITDAQAAGLSGARASRSRCTSTRAAPNSRRRSLADNWKRSSPTWRPSGPSLPAPRPTGRTASRGATGRQRAEGRAAHGIRLDTNYYYWPGRWVQNRPGLFTGSGFPMRFADTDGSLIDVYQAATQLTDESDIDIPTHIEALLDGALGPTATTASSPPTCTPTRPDHPGADAIVARGAGPRRAGRLGQADARLARRPQRLVVRRPELRRRPAAFSVHV